MRPSEEMSRSSARPSVVLPEPDSPTTPSVCPSRTATSTPSTALMWPTVRRKKPRWIGNQTLRSSPLTMTRRVGLALRRLALRLGGEEMPRIGVLRVGEDLFGRPLLDDLAVGHHADPVGDPPHDAEVVGDEQHRHARLGLEPRQQLEDLRLHGHVERGGRLVGDEEVGLVGERHGDHDALPLPAGELVRIGAEPLLRLADADLRREAPARAPAPPRRSCRDARRGSRRPAARPCAAG